MAAQSAIVLGAGMVGVSVALHLRRRSFDVALVDRRGPGEGASFGNGGLIQREAVYPHPFPRDPAELRRIALNRAADAVYHPLALPGLAAPLLRYWWHSEPRRYVAAVRAHATLIATCLDEHLALARGDAAAAALMRPVGWMRMYDDVRLLDAAVDQAEAAALMRPVGWMRMYDDVRLLEAAVAQAEAARRGWGVNFAVLDGKALADAEPHLLVERVGALHWTDPISVSDPHGLTMAYARQFLEAGGRLLAGDAATLARAGNGWRVRTAEGPVEAAQVVVALGAASDRATRPLGYAPPLFGKRGYHMHYRPRGNATLNRPVFDVGTGFLLAPMRAGIRLTTGAEFARPDAPPTPVQLERAEPVARTIFPLGERVEGVPWMGVRPCTPDMLPVIGPLPGQAGAWCAFGHAHQGFTLGPSTGRLLAEMMTGEAPFVPPEPYAPARFW